MFEAERVVDDFLDDDTRYPIVVARRQEGFQHHIAFTAGDDNILTLQALLSGRMRAVRAIGKQAEPLHQLRGEIVAQKGQIVLGAAHLKEFVPSGQGRLPRGVHLVPALFNVHQDRISQIIGVD